MVRFAKVATYFTHYPRNQIHAIDSTTLELQDKGLVAILGNSGSRKNNTVKRYWRVGQGSKRENLY